MKRVNKYVVLSILFMMPAYLSFSQVQDSRRYRVIAYKEGNPQVFSISNEVQIVPAISIYVPNTFTPNGDGINDTFGITGEAVKSFSMQIFNRWGQLLFESDNTELKWDGTFQGEPVPQGSYAYKITASGNSGKQHLKEGYLNVVL